MLITIYISHLNFIQPLNHEKKQAIKSNSQFTSSTMKKLNSNGIYEHFYQLVI